MKGARACLWIFLFMAFLITAVPVLHSLGLPIRQRVTAVFHVVSLSLLALACWQYSTFSPIPRAGSYIPHVVVTAIWMVLMTVNGFLHDYGMWRIAPEMWVLGMMLLMLLLGRHDQAWKDLEKPMLVFFYAGLVLIILGMSRQGVSSQEGDAVTERKVDTLAFQIRGMVYFWPILFATAYVRREWSFWKVLGLATPLIIIVLELFSFKFRTNVLLAVMQIGMMFLVVPLLQKRLQLGRVLLIVAVGLGVYLVLAGTYEYEAFMERFEQVDKWAFRFREGSEMISQMSPLDWLIGKGAAGWYWPPYQFGNMPRMETHVGLLQPLLKGGLVFTVLLCLFYLRLFLPKGPDWKANPINVVATGVLPIFLIYLVTNPFPTEQIFLFGVAGSLAAARMGTPAPPPEEILYLEDASEYSVPAQSVEAYNYGRMGTF